LFDGRPYDSITAYNVKGYDMKPMEFTRMEGVSGTSGAPVLNGLGQSSGVFHGLIGDMAYVVSAKDVIHFFNKFNVVGFNSLTNKTPIFLRGCICLYS
jgi:hypothetical protein